MRDEQNRQPQLLAQIIEDVQNLRLNGYVQRRNRLIGNQQIRLCNQRAGNALQLRPDD